MWKGQEGKGQLSQEWKDKTGWWGWGGFIEKVALELRPKGWCNLAGNAKRKHIRSRGTGMCKGAEAGRRSSPRDGFWKGFLYRINLRPRGAPMSGLVMFPTHASLFHTAKPLPSPLPDPPANSHTSSMILLRNHFPSPAWAPGRITRSPAIINLACTRIFVYSVFPVDSISPTQHFCVILCN